jgi:hypothetical protein
MALTNVKGEGYTQYSASGLSNLVTKLWGQPVLSVTDNYTVPAGETVAASTSLYMGVVPKGARVLGFYFSQSGAGAAATGGIKIGSTAATATTALTNMTAATAQLLPCIQSVAKDALTADSVVSILLTNAGDLAAATTFTLTTFYVME